MARLSIVYTWNGEPATYKYPQTLSTIEIQLGVVNIFADGFARVPTQYMSIDDKCPRTVYLIPVHQILRFVVELDADEECPEPEI